MSNREIDLSKPTLIGLSYLLRNDALWPIGFRWDFGTSDTCAMGLACEVWNIEWQGGRKFGEHFGMTQSDVSSIFYGRGDWAPKIATSFLQSLMGSDDPACSKITPEMVADAIDDYLLRQVVNHPQPKMTAVAA